MITRIILNSLLLSVVAFLSAEAIPPSLVNYQGRLLDAEGNPINGSVSVSIGIYTNQSSGNSVYAESIGSVPVQNGLYSFQFGSNASDLLSALSYPETWLQLSIDNSPLAPRERLVTVPYAIVATTVQGPDLFVDSGIGSVGVGVISPQAKLDVRGAVDGIGLSVEALNEDDVAIAGEGGSAGFGTGVFGLGFFGVSGISQASGGVGVTGGGDTGIEGVSQATDGTGVLGRGNTGVTGVSEATDGTGVTGISVVPDGTGVLGGGDTGVSGISEASGGTGVFGTGDTGVGGFSEATDGMGVVGISVASGGIGVLGSGDSVNGGSAGYFDGDLGVTGEIYGFSDCRLKKNIVALQLNALRKLRELRVVEYDWKQDPHSRRKLDSQKKVGFIAQEVKSVLPDIVADKHLIRIDENGQKVSSNPGEEKYLAINKLGLIPLLVKGVQEQQEIIDALQKEINLLKEAQ